MTIEQINEQGREIFGDYDFEKEIQSEAYEAYLMKLKTSGEADDKVLETIPSWVEDKDYFDLYMMTEEERKAWYAANAPKVEVFPANLPTSQIPYFPAKLYKETKPTKVGNIRI